MHLDERVKKRSEDYNTVKDALTEKMWEQVLGYFPQLKDRVRWLFGILAVYTLLPKSIRTLTSDPIIQNLKKYC